jgi:hypothetical protein
LLLLLYGTTTRNWTTLKITGDHPTAPQWGGLLAIFGQTKVGQTAEEFLGRLRRESGIIFCESIEFL